MSIVKMKRLRLIGMKTEREELLRLLQHLGCVEIEEPKDKSEDPQWAGLTRPNADALAAARDARSTTESALKTLKRYAPKQKAKLLVRRPIVSETDFFDDKRYMSALDDADRLVELERQISGIYAEQNKLKTQKLSLIPWLELDIPLETSSTREVMISFGAVSLNANIDAMEEELKTRGGPAQILRAGSDGELQYMVVLCHKSVEEACLDILKEYGFYRSALRGWTGTAAQNNARLDEELREIEKRLESARNEAASFAPNKAELELCLDRTAQEIAREQSKSRLLDTKAVFFLDGWVPAPDEQRLIEKLSSFICCWHTEDPAVEDYPQVPIKLKNNVLTAQASAITDMYSLPAYDGIDANPLVLPFYVFFFGFMFADLAYGLILFTVCTVIQRITRPKGDFGKLVRLMIMCGLASAIIGFFTGGFFSDSISRFCGIIGAATPAIPFLTGGYIGGRFFGPVLDVMRDPMTALIVALVIGFVQIIVGMLVKFIKLCSEGAVLDAILDVGTWWVIFLGFAFLALDIGIVNGVPVVLVIGGIMLLFAGRHNKGAGKIIGIFSAIYDGVTGYFGDILSYARLMVMMLASSVIGQVFNILGTMPGNIFVFIIIFVIGHAFNMAINVIGTYVHTSRLQYLEFFKQFYKDGGRPFRPLALETKYVDIKEEQ